MQDRDADYEIKQRMARLQATNSLAPLHDEEPNPYDYTMDSDFPEPDPDRCLNMLFYPHRGDEPITDRSGRCCLCGYAFATFEFRPCGHLCTLPLSYLLSLLSSQVCAPTAPTYAISAPS